VPSQERRVVLVTAGLHGIVHGTILSIPVLLERAWRSEFVPDDLTQGLLAATAYACFGLGSVPFGHLADRMGAPRLLVVCVLGLVASLGVLSVSPGPETLTASLALVGFFAGIYHPTGLALISRTVSAPGTGMGWHGMGGSLGIALGPAFVGGMLATGVAWRVVVAALLAPVVASLVILVASRLEDPVLTSARVTVRASVRRVLRGAFGLVLLVYLLAGVAYWGGLTFLPRFIGTGSYVVLLSLGALGQVVAGHLADRPRFERTLLALSVGAALALAALAVPGALSLPAIAWAFGLLLFSLEPLQNTLVTRQVEPRSRGIAFGMTFLSVFGLGSVGAALAGFLLQQGFETALFGILAAFLVASGVSAYVAERVRKTSAEDGPSGMA
jgi:MFS family permease